jgi:hypothetical protein
VRKNPSHPGSRLRIGFFFGSFKSGMSLTPYS